MLRNQDGEEAKAVNDTMNQERTGQIEANGCEKMGLVKKSGKSMYNVFKKSAQKAKKSWNKERQHKNKME